MASGGEYGLFTSLPEQSTPERAGGGLPRLRFADRDQIAWRPVSLEGLLADDHRVRLVWGFVEGLDLTALHATIKAADGRPGHPPADPRILLALWLCATAEGIGSAREVARLCGEHIAFQWLGGGVGMNAKTLADFRVDHGAVLEQLLVGSFTALVRADVASLERIPSSGYSTGCAGGTLASIAQDGVRVRASAGAASFRRHSTLQDCRREAEKALVDMRAQVNADPGAASRQQAAARQRATEDRERRVRAALAGERGTAPPTAGAGAPGSQARGQKSAAGRCKKQEG
jgi:transposase